jgi:dipeptidyl-peptidase III
MGIYGIIMSLHEIAKGDWNGLAVQYNITEADMQGFLDYAACFLSNIGNYYAS